MVCLGAGGRGRGQVRRAAAAGACAALRHLTQERQPMIHRKGGSQGTESGWLRCAAARVA
jgi:hypothetical protein